jgi:hypothetical protein
VEPGTASEEEAAAFEEVATTFEEVAATFEEVTAAFEDEIRTASKQRVAARQLGLIARPQVVARQEA